MPKTSTTPVDAEEIAEMVDRKQDISAHFTNQFIKTKQDHRAAVTRIEELMSAAPGTPEGNELDKLATVVDAYERDGSGANRERGRTSWSGWPAITRRAPHSRS